MNAEQILRRYDKALRLRPSVAQPHLWLIERKTFRGSIGSMSPKGIPWTVDTGRRREEGHVLVGSVPRAMPLAKILETLQDADTWKHERPLWQRVEDADTQRHAAKNRHRTQELTHKAHETFDRYVWTNKQRVSVPVQVI